MAYGDGCCCLDNYGCGSYGPLLLETAASGTPASMAAAALGGESKILRSRLPSCKRAAADRATRLGSAMACGDGCH